MSAAPRWWPWLLGVALVALVVSICTPAGRHQWALSLARQPSPTTTMFFTEPTDQLSASSPGGPVKLRFTVGNDEGRSMTYAYVLTQRDGTESRTLGRGSMMIYDRDFLTVTRRVTPTCRHSPCRLEVSLAGRPQSIYVLVNVKPTGDTHA